MPNALKSQKKKAKYKAPTKRWDTSDEEELYRRQFRAREENFEIKCLDSEDRFHGLFQVESDSGRAYQVEIRDLSNKKVSCECIDFNINGLGTCKHIEALLLQLKNKKPRLYAKAEQTGSDLSYLVVKENKICLEGQLKHIPPRLREQFNDQGILKGKPERLVNAIQNSRSKKIKLSIEVHPHLQRLEREKQKVVFRREYEKKVQRGIYPSEETKLPLYPYQREGMLHLAFKERALLADEMGLGKTIQAVAACALLKRLGRASRVLIVSPASLKTEWEEQIQTFTDLALQIIFGNKVQRKKAYAHPPFFTLMNYEQIIRDHDEINTRLKPDIVVLDEAQRIKNWGSQTAQSIKRLQSHYAFVLTGTPIENRIDELYSIINFLDPGRLGPLFRFNREYYEMDERGRPAVCKNLDGLHQRTKPLILRRRKKDVETQLPDRSDHKIMVEMSLEQLNLYAEHEQEVGRILHLARQRILQKHELDKLLRELGMMRMCCDTAYILDPEAKECPKLKELEQLIPNLLSDPEAKILIFSEWVKMLALIANLLDKIDIGYARHIGMIPQVARRKEIRRFKDDPNCRIMLSSDSGGVGLNLQNANTVIHCDLPWNPAILEQRTARVWRKHQLNPVNVYYLISSDTIEERMQETLATKTRIAESVVDGTGENRIDLRAGGQSFMDRLEKIMAAPQTSEAKIKQTLGDKFEHCETVEDNEKTDKTHVVVTNKPVSKSSTDKLKTAGLEPGKNTLILDPDTIELLHQLEQLGLIQRTRKAQQLFATIHKDRPKKLDKKKIESRLSEAERQLKMSCLLSDAGFDEESKPSLETGLLKLAQANALLDHILEPESYQKALDQGIPVFGKLSIDPHCQSMAEYQKIVKFFKKQLSDS